MAAPSAPAAGQVADVLIVGAGASGCAVAARLAADPGRQVLLVEAGGWPRHPLLAVPKAFVRTMQSPRLTSRYAARPTQAGPTETWVRGRGVGGSTIVNGALYLRGERHLYDELASQLGQAWGWRAWRAAFEQVERQLPVTGGTLDGELHDAVLDGFAELGVPVLGDPRDADGPRAAASPSTTTVRGRRATAAALLRPGLRRGNLRVVTGARAERVVLEGGRAVGVEVALGSGERVTHRAKEQVVVSAGALESPLLLERSGIGDPLRLSGVGITPRVVSPAVGEGLREQRGVVVKARVRDGLGTGEALATRAGVVREGVRLLLTGRSAVGGAAYEVAASVLSTVAGPGPGGGRPDLQLLLTQLATDGTGLTPAPHAGLMLQAYPLVPTSTGSVHASGPSVDDVPRIAAPLVGSEDDEVLVERALQAARRLLGTTALADLAVEELLPGDAVPAGAVGAAADFARGSGGGIFHAVGTCAAGGAGAVLDERLRVRGVEALRVADLSAMPRHTSGASAAVALALGTLSGGWLAEDLG